MWQETVSIAGPYDFQLALDRLKLDPLNVVVQNKSVKVPLTIESKQIVIEVMGTGSLEKPQFVVKGTEEKEQALQRLCEIFRWDVELTTIHKHFQETNLKLLFENHYGTPLILDFDPFSSLLKCIIHQQLNLAFAHTLTERFMQTFGNEIDGVWFYPTPEKVALIKVEQLRELQFSARKAEYVIGIAELVTTGALNFNQMKQMTNEEISSELIKIRGVGPWTVQNFLMFALGRENLFPVADIGLQNALRLYYNLEQKPTKAEMERFKEPWEPYLSYAALYLWRSIE
ncbi:DNA-3-methyladenine glycosylase II [Mesobacillus persicus]|uniref:DNA-3-methyladenine glycosylase II n=1 Tax=Mesobacillus persicus TaxID=930146 RepID=A0A1H8CKN5_9BACI|nr:DNA-3-methyladenine glycosylase [Mesobacillus persicus]SEM95605.1 DNA-3-methyladenine glycosylase II [Mesobacillus persicus]